MLRTTRARATSVTLAVFLGIALQLAGLGAAEVCGAWRVLGCIEPRLLTLSLCPHQVFHAP